MACLVILTIAGGYLYLQFVSVAFGEKCEDNRVWKIEGYQIIEKKCIGFAGPYYYPVSLYKDGEEIGQILFTPDSTCLVEFVLTPADTLIFDVCENKLR